MNDLGSAPNPNPYKTKGFSTTSPDDHFTAEAPNKYKTAGFSGGSKVGVYGGTKDPSFSFSNSKNYKWKKKDPANFANQYGSSANQNPFEI